MADAVSSPDRHVRLDSAFNFRDLGGYAGAGGRRVRWQRLYRADSLGGLSPADLDRLSALGLRTVVDLRTGGEVEERGRISDPGGRLRYWHLPLIDVLPPAESFENWAEPAYVADQYAQMLASGTDSLRHALGLLADPANLPLAYHCMAGKDRTGILTAIVLRLLGVADDDIVADYALSRQAMARKVVWSRANLPPDRHLRPDAPGLRADPETMRLFLEHLDGTYGGATGFTDAVGMGGVATRLQAGLLA